MSAYRPTGPLPTIADARDNRETRIRICCANPNCAHSGTFTFDSLGLPDSTLLIEIPNLRRFVCQRCGGRHVSVMDACEGQPKTH